MNTIQLPLFFSRACLHGLIAATLKPQSEVLLFRVQSKQFRKFTLRKWSKEVEAALEWKFRGLCNHAQPPRVLSPNTASFLSPLLRPQSVSRVSCCNNWIPLMGQPLDMLEHQREVPWLRGGWRDCFLRKGCGSRPRACLPLSFYLTFTINHLQPRLNQCFCVLNLH